MSRLKMVLLVGFVALVTIPGFAGQYTLFGPKQYVRGTGKPVTETIDFASPVVGTGFTLSVQNGNSQGHSRVSSATVTLNGNRIFGPADFNKQVGSLQYLTSLDSLNTLAVSLASTPGSLLTLTITGEDNTPPAIAITSPLNGSVVSAGSITITGSIIDDTPVTVVVNGVTAMVADGTFTANAIPLSLGQNMITSTATDLGGNSASSTITVTQGIYPPDVVGMAQENAQSAIIAAKLVVGNVTSAYSDSVPAGNIISQNPLPTALVLPGAAVDFVVSKGAATVPVPNVVGMTKANAETAVRAANLQLGNISTAFSNTVPTGSIVSQSPAANAVVAQGTPVVLVVSDGPAPIIVPPDPTTVAPPLDDTVATTVAASTAFLYSGPNPIQTGVVAGTIEIKRAAVLRGQVSDRDGNPLSGVAVTILGHPEFGQTVSRVDGMFDMAVNGGGLLTVSYEKSGYLPVQRQVNAPWQDYAWLPAVALIPVDAQVTTIDLTSSGQIQAHRGNVVTDADGSRQVMLLFSPGTTAEMIMPDGSTQPVGSLNVRATEYTVGPNGPKAMPGQLPPASGYTYAVELSADEAIAAGAKEITFSQPVFVYVDNFIGFPVGEPVPSGYYDRGKGQWIAAPNGRVINILSITDGIADIDTDGDGQADDAADLATLGITQAERQQLATLYPQTPKQLWRVPVPHFSAWDFNWPFGPPPDATDPKQPEPKPHPTSDPCEQGGSIIECQNQVLGERIGVAGTPFTLNYRSNRVPGNKSAYTLDIPLSGASIPASLQRIELIIEVAGRQFSRIFPAAANQSYTFTWDGKDAYGQTVQGKQSLTARVGYVYGGQYLTAKPSPGYDEMFGHFSYYGTPVTGSMDTREVTLWQVEHLSFAGGAAINARSQGIGGWDLDIHHVYDPAGKVLMLGDGSWRSADSADMYTVVRVAGNGNYGYSGDGGPATNASLKHPGGIAAGPDGSIYVTDFSDSRIRRVGPDGIITTVAGNGNKFYGGDGGPAISASLDGPYRITVGPDGSIYFIDTNYYSNASRIRRVGPDGIITTVAGNGGNDYGGDGGLATYTSLYSLSGIAVGSDGSIYIAGGNSIRRVAPDGIITTVAGNGNFGYGRDGVPAISASLYWPSGLAVGPDGSIYFADVGNNPPDSRIRRVGPDGIITTVAGNGYRGYSGDGGSATSASLFCPTDVAVGPDGKIYISDSDNDRIRLVGAKGIITTLAGGGNYDGDGGPATSTAIIMPTRIALGPDGSIYFAGNWNSYVRRVVSAWPVSSNEISIPSEDGNQLYIFNSSGKHLRTLNALTSATLFSFGYDSGGRLASITDASGNITTIERDANGNPMAIVAPFGQRTTLTLDANGYLASVTNPANESTRMSYDGGGLMTTFADPKGNIHEFIYNDYGLLVRDANPAGGFTALTGTSTTSSKQEVLTTALARESRYLTEYLTTGDERLTITLPTGAQSVTLTKTDGSIQTTMPDGTISNETSGIDPRFGTLVYIPATMTVKTPFGLTQSVSLTRTATLTDSSNLLSLASQTNTLTINGRVYTSVYNSLLQTYTLATPSGRTSSKTIDSLGRPVSLLSAPNLMPVSFSYDGQGFLSSVSQGSQVTTYGYDPLKRLNSLTNANGQSTLFAYDVADRVNKLTLPSGRSYQFVYDANGNRTSITMPNGVAHKLGYTVIDQNSDYAPPSNLPYAWQYSLDREWTSTILPGGRTVNAAYDTGGRPTGIVFPEASVGFLYNDKTDRISSLVRTPAAGGAAQQIGFTYDGSLVTSRAFSGAANGKFAYTYDNNFFLKQIVTTSGSNTVTTPIMRDADGLVTAFGPFSFTRGGPAGAVSKINDTALTIDVTYDNLGRVASRTHSVAGKNIYSVQFTYDNTGNIVRKAENIPDMPVTWEYTYDVDGQLVQTKKNGADEEIFGYDVNGNRISSQRSGQSAVLAEYDDQDRLVQQGGVHYWFNQDGQLTQRGADTFQYSAQGELLQATVNGQQITYAYDGMGRRVARTDSNGTYQYLYGDLRNPFQLTAMRDPGGVLTNFYYDEGGVLFAFDKGATRYYVGADQLGTPRIVTDVAGTVVDILEYDSFGMPRFMLDPAFDLPVGFAGGLVDTKTWLERFGYRDYDPNAGRWTAKDPIFFKGGQGNLFGYVQNNPIRYRDPYGLSGWDSVMDIGGYVTDASGTGGYTGGAIGGAIGATAGSAFGPAGTVVGGLAGGLLGGAVGGLFDPPGAGELNHNEIVPRPHIPPPPPPPKPMNCHSNNYPNSPELRNLRK